MSYYGFPHGSWGVSHQALWAAAAAAAVGGGALVTGETDALGIDFTYHTDRSKQMEVITSSSPVDSDPYATLTYTSPSIKLCRQSDGVWRYGSHNLYLNSASPANQSVTVVASGTYSVVITGSVSITVSGAATATYTSGTNNFTAATTTLTCGSTSGSGTVAVFRTPCVGTYLATAGAIKIDLPYEWNTSNASQGILIEEARTNLVLRSQEYDNATWTKGNSSTISANATTAPDGTSTADGLIGPNSGGNLSYLQSGATVTTAATTWSVFVKPGSKTKFWLDAYDGSTHYTWFDLSGAGSVLTNAAGNTASITLDTNGWYRLVVTRTAGSTTALHDMWFADTDTVLGTSGDGVTVHGYVWDAQVETGSFATSPIHTIGATVTRAVDTISLTASGGFPVSSTLGTLYAKFNPINVGAIRYALAQDDDTANEHFSIGSSAAGAGQFNVVDGGAAQTAPLTNGTVTAGSANKVAASWDGTGAGDFAVSTNGTAVSQDSSGTLPTVTKLKFGVGNTSTNVLNGYLQHVVSLPRAMTDPQLVTIST